MDAPPTSRWLPITETGGDSGSLLWKFEEALELESSFPSFLRMPSVSKDPEEITLAMRNGCAQVLRCLKVWYDLPSEVLFLATAHLDHFLSRMKVRPKHLSVIALSCFHLSSKQVAYNLEENCGLLSGSTSGGTAFNVPDPRDLLVISQCRCSLGDLSRMEAIVAEKLSSHSSQCKSPGITSSSSGHIGEKEWSPVQLSVNPNVLPGGKTFASACQPSIKKSMLSASEYSLHSDKHHLPSAGRQHNSSLQILFPHHPILPYPVTPACFLHLIHSFLVTSMRNKMGNKSSENNKWTAGDINELLAQVSCVRLLHHLEAIACDGSLSCFRPSEVALSLICVMLDQILGSVTCLSSPSVAHNNGRQSQSLGMLSSVMEVKNICKITDARFTRCHSAVLMVVRYYESQCDASHWYASDGSTCTDEYEDELSIDEEDEDERNIRSWKRNSQLEMRRRKPGAYVEGWGPLAWRVSQRTLRNLRPTEKLVAWPPMPTIYETNLCGRIRSCSLSSEESSDPGEEEEEYEMSQIPERGNEWRPMPVPTLQTAWAAMNSLPEEEVGEE